MNQTKTAPLSTAVTQATLPDVTTFTVPDITQAELHEARRNMTHCELRFLACDSSGDYSNRNWQCPRFKAPRRKSCSDGLLTLPSNEVTITQTDGYCGEHENIHCGAWVFKLPANLNSDFILSLKVEKDVANYARLNGIELKNYYDEIFCPSNVEAYVRNYYGSRAYAKYARLLMASFDECLGKIMATLRERHPNLQRRSLTCSERSELLMARVPGVEVINHYAVIDFT